MGPNPRSWSQGFGAQPQVVPAKLPFGKPENDRQKRTGIGQRARGLIVSASRYAPFSRPMHHLSLFPLHHVVAFCLWQDAVLPHEGFADFSFLYLPELLWLLRSRHQW